MDDGRETEDELYARGFVPVPAGSGWFGYSNAPDSVLRYMALDAYYEMLAEQDEGCSICGRHQTAVGPLVVEHDHSTGEVRSLSCQHCNLGLGHFFEDPELLRSAIAYIEKHGSWATRGEDPPPGWLWYGSIPGADRPPSVRMTDTRPGRLVEALQRQGFGRCGWDEQGGDLLVMFASSSSAVRFAELAGATPVVPPGEAAAFGAVFSYDRIDEVLAIVDAA